MVVFGLARLGLTSVWCLVSGVCSVWCLVSDAEGRVRCWCLVSCDGRRRARALLVSGFL
jgi:hypothetical protein